MCVLGQPRKSPRADEDVAGSVAMVDGTPESSLERRDRSSCPGQGARLECQGHRLALWRRSSPCSSLLSRLNPGSMRTRKPIANGELRSLLGWLPQRGHARRVVPRLPAPVDPVLPDLRHEARPGRLAGPFVSPCAPISPAWPRTRTDGATVGAAASVFQRRFSAIQGPAGRVR